MSTMSAMLCQPCQPCYVNHVNHDDYANPVNHMNYVNHINHVNHVNHTNCINHINDVIHVREEGWAWVVEQPVPGAPRGSSGSRAAPPNSFIQQGQHIHSSIHTKYKCSDRNIQPTDRPTNRTTNRRTWWVVIVEFFILKRYRHKWYRQYIRVSAVRH